jgi:hypothetical protein
MCIMGEKTVFHLAYILAHDRVKHVRSEKERDSAHAHEFVCICMCMYTYA